MNTMCNCHSCHNMDIYKLLSFEDISRNGVNLNHELYKKCKDLEKEIENLKAKNIILKTKIRSYRKKEKCKTIFE